ncbi:MAG: M23 family metallopeptidase [Gemmatimonadaceae bacterium]
MGTAVVPTNTVRRLRLRRRGAAGFLTLCTLAGCAHARAATRPPVREPARPAASVPAAIAPARELEYLRSRRLIVPVAGAVLSKIADSFDAPRGDRRHNAVDILAPRGTPVLSADDGVAYRLRTNAAGGLVIYATDPARRLIYYYAHLDRYGRRLAEGMPLARGDTIGFVGTSGNAPPNVPHLHFQVMLADHGSQYWAGTPVSPLPYFGAQESRR